ncbi:hypothetical protein JCM33374_g2111 [Metschnikowia sp. JCM 33374]|nr:hypothetical protein JCM33374_g2111 [Metschnikowia sp. JCM 33374]
MNNQVGTKSDIDFNSELQNPFSPSGVSSSLGDLGRPELNPFLSNTSCVHTPIPDTQSILDTNTVSLSSLALSDADTFTSTWDQGFLVRSSFQESINSYTPNFLRRKYEPRSRNVSNDNYSDDDDRTIFSKQEFPSIMHKETNTYTHIRKMIIASELIGNSVYVFHDSESFEIFKGRKKNKKKPSIRSTNSYEDNFNLSSDHSMNTNENKVTARKGFPILKIVVPYMSTFRPKTPYMIFRRYFESPRHDDPISAKESRFSNYDFFLAFQNNYRPFTDFNYKDTGFRIFGTSKYLSYPSYYNPELKLFILDEDQASLADNLISKPKSSIFSMSGKKKGFDDQAFESLVPSPNNPIIRRETEFEDSPVYGNSVPHGMPSFGKFLDACAYTKEDSILPKRYSEVGKLAVYEGPLESQSSEQVSSLTVDEDSVVLTTVFLALRETNLRTALRKEEVRGLPITRPLAM